MSGAFTHRVNRSWNRGDQANVSCAVFFWEFLNYFDNHLGFDFVGYGTGKSQTGVEPPAEWKAWDPVTMPIPVGMGDNSWFVVEAKNADALLDGGGSHPWQLKFQYTGSSGFDDCNVADINYGQEGGTWRMCTRANAMGGWDSVACDFSPVTGEENGNNMRTFEGQDENFYLDIIGDDDTIFWKGSAFDTTEYLAQTRGGYVGMLRRRSNAIDIPFFMKVGNVVDFGANTGGNAINSRATGNSYYEWQADGYWNRDILWPSYSVWSDGTKVTTHHQDCWDYDSLPDVTWDPANSEDIVPAMLVSQKQAPDKHAVIGEYRLIGAGSTRYGQHTVFGTDSDWIEICYQPTTYGGIAMKWPTGVVPIW